MTLLQTIDDKSNQELTSAGVKRPRVFVTNWAGHDFSPALSWTSLPAKDAFVAITAGDIDIHNFDRLIFNIRLKLIGFRSDDYLLLSGHSIIFSFALHILINNFAEVKTLIWDNRLRRYQLKYVSRASFKLPLDPDNVWLKNCLTCERKMNCNTSITQTDQEVETNE